MGTAAEVKKNGGEGGRETYHRVSHVDKELHLAFLFAVLLLVTSVQLSKHSLALISRTHMLHFCRNWEALGFSHPPQAHLSLAIFV